MQSVVLVNGNKTDSLPVSDRGLQYGDGVWETIAIRDGQPQFLKDHFERLLQGCKALAIAAPELTFLESEIQQMCTSVKQQAVLKVIITRGRGGRAYRPEKGNKAKTTRILSLHPWGDHIEKFQQQGIHLQLCKTRLAYNPQLAGFKHLNRLEQVLAAAELSPDVEEGLMRDFTDHVIEGTMSNLFVVTRQQQIKTPRLARESGCGIKGIMRQKVMDWLSTLQYNVTEEPLTLDDILDARSLFMSNSIIGIWPVRTFANKSFVIPGFVAQFNAFLTKQR